MNYPQEKYWKLLKVVDFPYFNGEIVCNDLESLSPLVKGFVPASSQGSLRTLLRLIRGKLELDTLYILCAEFDAHVIKRYGKAWNASEIEIIKDRALEGAVGIPSWDSNGLVVVRLWWDLSRK